MEKGVTRELNKELLVYWEVLKQSLGFTFVYKDCYNLKQANT